MIEMTETQKYVGAVENAVKILRRLTQVDAPEGVATIARETGLNGSTTFNILKTLVKEGLVVFDEQTKGYAIGAGVMELAAPFLGRNPVDIIRPVITDVCLRHQVLVALWNITPTGRIVLSDRVVPENVVHADMRPGARLPDMVGAVGRCVAAQRGLDRAQLQTAYEALRWQNPPGFEAYHADVEKAAVEGFAFDFGNLFIGLNMAAVVVRDLDGVPRLGLSAISIAGQKDESGLTDAALALREARDFIETNVFGRQRPLDTRAGSPG
ncbi:IclR family transcriptional regulator [Rhodalgimonas zhirmunskyi]|uniref:Helix-turn-helix domain-containing protein n=1 Tax=Rhodalgimonas zhirmunskyi TaxID=2964767 RepID=A0AAJ1U881_9RHOB|nr:helix-turn-helix domain-containing protein [Rhodoalgimonas zhirmunskyi]MDQ2095146.1 helix-turn-helix domain-containing protein [Rhodoalgimonas zhirmunskyi]